MNKKYLTIRDMVEIAMLTSLAIILNMKVFAFTPPLHEAGGSINFSLIPLFILAYRQGVIKGFIGAGVIYGLIAILFDGYPFYSYPFDYLLACGSIAIAGFWKKDLSLNFKEHRFKMITAVLLSTLIAGIFYNLSHVVGGVIFYNATWEFSFGYNLSYGIPSILLASIALILLLPGLSIINKLYPIKIDREVEENEYTE